MNNSITWVKAAKDYHGDTPELLVQVCTSIKNQLVIDPDVPVAGSPVTMLDYISMINDVSTGIVARQTSRDIALTSDEHAKISTLLHNTDLIVGYIDGTTNRLFPGDITHIETILARFGLKPVGHGHGHKHIFSVLSVLGDSATIEAPVAEGVGPTAGVGASTQRDSTTTSITGFTFHWRWYIDPTDKHQVKSTHKSSVTIDGLPHDKRVFFEYDFSVGAGRGKHPHVAAAGDDFHWSDPISEIIR